MGTVEFWFILKWLIIFLIPSSVPFHFKKETEAEQFPLFLRSNSRSLNQTVGHRRTGHRRITGIFEKPGSAGCFGLS